MCHVEGDATLPQVAASSSQVNHVLELKLVLVHPLAHAVCDVNKNTKLLYYPVLVRCFVLYAVILCLCCLFVLHTSLHGCKDRLLHCVI